jgi:predicted Rossmann fold nucleotide-binding protein DprA/Smf involved in DNA uptake
MARRPDSSLAALLLTQRLVDTGAAALKASEYWKLLEVVGDPGRLLGLDAARITADLGVPDDLAARIERRLAAATAFAFALDEAEQSGLQVLASVDDDYPVVLKDRLGSSAPPLLTTAGDVGLLTRDLLGVVSSRDVSDATATVAGEAARAAVAEGWGVVSGGAEGVDRLAMDAALHGDGVAVGVLADSLVRVTRDAEVRRAVTDGRLCLCTPYKPTAGFTVANAMGRNKVIYALSRATLVVASGHDHGGTWAGATESLKRRIASVLVWTGEGAGPGNPALVERGGHGVGAADRIVAQASAVADAPCDPCQLHLGV